MQVCIDKCRKLDNPPIENVFLKLTSSSFSLNLPILLHQQNGRAVSYRKSGKDENLGNIICGAGGIPHITVGAVKI